MTAADLSCAAELAAGARDWAGKRHLPVQVRDLLEELAAVADATVDRTSARGTLRLIREALAGHPRCDVHPGDEPPSCGWKSAVASVQWALDQDQPSDSTEAENKRLRDQLAQEQKRFNDLADQYEIVLQDAATVLGVEDADLLDVDIPALLQGEAKRPRTARTPAELDALPRDTVVFTRDPRYVPGSALWIRADDAENSAWWRIGEDDTFRSEDVLYGDPREVRILYIPAYTPDHEENPDA